MKRRSTIIFQARLILVFLAMFAVFGGTMLSAVPVALQFPGSTVNQRITVVGRLELAGQNYFLDPRFVIVDSQNNRIPVVSWAPLELPPTRPPGNPLPGSQSRTMQDYLHQQFSVTGIHRLVVGSPGQPGLPGAPGASYVEVESVIEIRTRALVFDATRPRINGEPEANAGPVIGTQPTGAQLPATPAAPPSPPQPTGAQRPVPPAGPKSQ